MGGRSGSLVWLVLASLIFFAGCNNKKAPNATLEEEIRFKKKNDLEPGKGYDFSGNGKYLVGQPFDSLYRRTPLGQLDIPPISEKLRSGFPSQTKVINRKNNINAEYGNLKMSKKKLLRLIEILSKDSLDQSKIQAYQLCGEDSLGNVHFTGYYTPVLKVKATPDSVFRFPLYKKPENWKGQLPTRKEIDREGLLKGRNLELAWTNDMLAIFFMQVQGSGMVEYPDGKQVLFAYGGSNGHKYRSLGKYLVYQGYIGPESISLGAIREWFAANPDSLNATIYYNPSYVFFRKAKGHPTGSRGVPLIAGHSVAIDPAFIPYGSVLIGKIPVLNADGVLQHHTYRWLLPQDAGGAIKGPGHIDLYMGTGKKGEELAGAMHHYGAIWLLLPK